MTKATRTEEVEQQKDVGYRALEVTVGSDLEGTTQISLTIVDSGVQTEKATVTG